MQGIGVRCAVALVAVFWSVSAVNAQAVQCEPPGGFSAWLENYKQHARAQGISESTINRALGNVSLDQEVLRLDRNQTAFRMSFEEFARQRVTQGRINQARQRMSQHAQLLDRIEDRYGVPREMLMAIWGMETDFGAVTGNKSVVRSLATLSYDCRRSEMFQRNLIAALRILDRGDLTMEEMRGAWAGEIGQAQFLAANYERFAVDFDGSGQRDLIRSVPDVLASIANYLASYGWRRGEPWDEGTHNFEVLREWNSASVYQRALALFANRLRNDGSAAGGGVAASGGLSSDQVRQMQQLLAERGHDVGPADGILGPRTRAAVDAARSRMGLPTGGEPTAEFIDRLRN